MSGSITFSGRSLIGFGAGEGGGRPLRGLDPVSGAELAPDFSPATEGEVDRACALAAQAFESYGFASGATHAALLTRIAEELETISGELITRAAAETGLGTPRLEGELARTTSQLRLFAGVAAAGSWVDARCVAADGERRPPRPDVRSCRLPIGPVAIFGASNFPLAFSVAGGDTASALAAGCPVVVKAHPAHPGTSELAGRAIIAAVRSLDLPAGVFSLLFDDGYAVGERLVRDSRIRAVGFTGSRAGGEALMKIAAERPEPIPVFAEMGSVNPVIVLPGALAERPAAIAAGLHTSFTLGAGQFCTNPGVVLVSAGKAGDALVSALAELTDATAGAAMLSPRISAGYQAGLERLVELGATLVTRGAGGEAAALGQAALLAVSGARVLAEPALLDEVFGPSTLVVRWDGSEELERLVRALPGQLTLTLQAADGELAEHQVLVRLCATKAGRLVFDQFPTGVDVSSAMVHGGPYPATSDGRGTSVGTRAIERFSRLVAYQNAPLEVLPAGLSG